MANNVIDDDGSLGGFGVVAPDAKVSDVVVGEKGTVVLYECTCPSCTAHHHKLGNGDPDANDPQ